MHLLVIFIVLAIAWQVRQWEVSSSGVSGDRPQQCLFLFLFPPLLLLTTAVAIVCMGFHGAMLGVKAGWLGYSISLGLIVAAGSLLLYLAYSGSRSLKQLKQLPQQSVADRTARILDVDFLYSAQIGFWHSELIVSRGLLTTLDAEHLEAVLAHEQAHAYYHDTFWFFWLGWLRNLTNWLPNTESLWQELLLWRELRADRRAAEQVDFLLLAESLLTVAQAPYQNASILSASFNDLESGDRLSTRIDYLLADSESIPTAKWQNWGWIFLVFLPLFTIPLHY